MLLKKTKSKWMESSLEKRWLVTTLLQIFKNCSYLSSDQQPQKDFPFTTLIWKKSQKIQVVTTEADEAAISASNTVWKILTIRLSPSLLL